jgi:hypothetical protein
MDRVPSTGPAVGQNHPMGLDIDFAFDVGEQEKHRVAFHWGQLFGRARITVDFMKVMEENQAVRLRGTKATRKFEFSVGDAEVHEVLIEKTRKRFLGGARKQACRAFVDGELIGEY